MLGERVFFLTRLPPPDGRPRDLQDIMRRTGGNTGNIFFVEALRRQLTCANSDFGLPADPALVSANFDYIAIPAANWIAARNPATHGLARFIEKVDLPCLVAGLGAQSLYLQSIPELAQETQRFLALISERSKVVGVRGQYTLRVVEHYGVKNAVPVGCPSFFWGLRPDLRIEKRNVDRLTVAVNASRTRIIRHDLNRKKLDVERALYSYAFSNEGSFVVPQTEELEISMGLGNPLSIVPTDIVDSFKEFFDPLMPNSGVERLRNKFKVFANVTDWMAELEKVDFVVGTRLHGCIMGLCAGTPSLLITIDSRTKEMAQMLRIPNIPVEKVRMPLDMRELYEQTDLGEMTSEYPRRFEAYRAFLEANGIAHNLAHSSQRSHAAA